MTSDKIILACLFPPLNNRDNISAHPTGLPDVSTPQRIVLGTEWALSESQPLSFWVEPCLCSWPSDSDADYMASRV